jgi:hypothetical protein
MSFGDEGDAALPYPRAPIQTSQVRATAESAAAAAAAAMAAALSAKELAANVLADRALSAEAPAKQGSAALATFASADGPARQGLVAADEAGAQPEGWQWQPAASALAGGDADGRAAGGDAAVGRLGTVSSLEKSVRAVLRPSEGGRDAAGPLSSAAQAALSVGPRGRTASAASCWGPAFGDVCGQGWAQRQLATGRAPQEAEHGPAAAEAAAPAAVGAQTDAAPPQPDVQASRGVAGLRTALP